jgi:methyl-accepting chemotaxis protein-1 (serine sensor receptor)
MKTSSLQFKMMLVAAGALAFALAVSVYALSRVYGSIQELDRITHEDFQSQQAIVHASISFRQQVDNWKNGLLRGADPEVLEQYWQQFLREEMETARRVQEARIALRNPEVLGKLEEFKAAHQMAGEDYRLAIEVFKKNRLDAKAADNIVAGTDRTPTQTLLEAHKMAVDSGAKATMSAVRSADISFVFAIAGTIVATVAVLITLWLFMRRAVLRPLGRAVDHAERIAQGDLTADIQATSRDEAGQLLGALARMNAGLSEVVSQVRAAAESVVTASGQVAMGTTDLSQRTEEQASSLEETAASMEELSSTVKQNADNAQKADELARGASKRAERGGSEVVRVVVTMNEISDSAAKIADIISVIDAIAFQTNILALNAAVEAARAGEQGRGFAVVAAEVRSLAQRSAQAAKEIKELIGNSVAKAKEGTDLVEQAGDTIQALVIDVKQVSELMGSIAEASAEQSRGVQQVNKTVTEMDKVVQQNAAAVQQSASAAEAMRRQAEALVKAVSAFRVSETSARAVPSARPQAGRPATVLTHAKPSNTLPAKKPAAAAGPAPAAAVSPSEEWEEF